LKPKDFSDQPRTLGEHLRQRRFELGLLQRDAAVLIGVSTDSYRAWETDRIRPRARSWRAIIGFLGYDPNRQPKTLGERLSAKRRVLGWTQRELAAHFGWDEVTIYRYLRGEWKPTGERKRLLEEFLLRDDPLI
jgi:transcriptional regulator with XRE-family HTH domain